jgi:PAS domain S-box-containing protein
MGSTEIDLVTDKREWSDEFYRLWGYVPGSVEAGIKVYLELLPAEEKERYLAWYTKAKARNNEPDPLELRLIRKDGTERHVYVKGQLRTEPADPGNSKLVGVVQDITDFNKAMLELEKQNRQLKEIAWTQSHVARAPLSCLMGLVKLLRDGVIGSGEDQTEILSYIPQSADELNKGVSDITGMTFAEEH